MAQQEVSYPKEEGYYWYTNKEKPCFKSDWHIIQKVGQGDHAVVHYFGVSDYNFVENLKGRFIGPLDLPEQLFPVT